MSVEDYDRFVKLMPLFEAGANLVIIGTAFEENPRIFDKILGCPDALGFVIQQIMSRFNDYFTSTKHYLENLSFVSFVLTKFFYFFVSDMQKNTHRV